MRFTGLTTHLNIDLFMTHSTTFNRNKAKHLSNAIAYMDRNRAAIKVILIKLYKPKSVGNISKLPVYF